MYLQNKNIYFFSEKIKKYLNGKHININNEISNYRFNRGEAIELLKNVPLCELMNLAHSARMNIFPNKCVSFVFDTNPNYTNICYTDCKFCAFSRKHTNSDSYCLSPTELALKVKFAESMGATTVLLQGGLNPDLKIKNWIEYLTEIKFMCPDIHIHPFSPSEYYFMAQQEKISVEEVLSIMWDFGIRTIPGGGAEILVERVRKILANNKITSNKWLEVSKIAHKIGFKTTATMMFGHVETDEDIVDHFIKLRELQDLTSGFVSFIPWSFKSSNTVLGKMIKTKVNPIKYIRIIATARLILDNFKHIQSSWFSESVLAGQLSLLAGADDFGGILFEENVHKEAGHERSFSLNEVIEVIKETGFIPMQRNSDYEIIKIYD